MRSPFPLALLSCFLVVSGAYAYAPYQTPPKIYQDLSDLAIVAVPAKVDIESALPSLEEPLFLVTVPLPRPRPQKTQKVEVVGPPLNLLAFAEKKVGATGRQLGMRHPGLWCAEAINAWLRSLGYKGTNSSLAVSFAHYGLPSLKPCVGCIGVKYRRGGSGHVVVIKAIKGDKVVVISPNGGGGRVRLSTYLVRVFYTFRMPVS